MKKFLVLILLACIFLCQLSPAVSAAEEICASIEPGEEYRLQNVTNYYFGAEDGTALVEREGRTGVQFHYLDPRTTYWYINTDDKFTISMGLSQLKGSLKTDWSAIMCGTCMSFVPGVVFYLLGQRYFVEGIVMTGMKN